MDKNVAFAKARAFLLEKGFANDVVPRSATKLVTFLQQSVSANQHLAAVHPELLEALGLEAMDRDLPDPLIALQAGERPTEAIGRQLMDLQIGDDALVELAPHLERQIRLAVERERLRMRHSFEDELNALRGRNQEANAQLRAQIKSAGNPVLMATVEARKARERRLIREDRAARQRG
ncbi:hypothetical protein KR100_00205 [Synechococcus sp. KORDI-100]|uniref:hypothetical protein n=1 Tax=Synechococcus sp. KORDI-100 TaxID=1280380 RepID=UPI0004E059FD|nr:hypothetical protein [Synechococcus sp. KORDI-100]AII41831.1 hypothetical protein KR100_00205 [Synechococcus sp. KORDI-100]